MAFINSNALKLFNNFNFVQDIFDKNYKKKYIYIDTYNKVLKTIIIKF